MKIFKSALVAGLLTAGAAQSATFDLTDEVFVAGSVTYDFAAPINGFQEEAGGVIFTFATAGQFRSVGPWNGGVLDPANAALSLGGGSGNPASFTLSASADVTLDAFVGFDRIFLIGAIFDVVGLGISSLANTFSTDAFLSTGTAVSEGFVGGPLSLAAGETYVFSATNPGASTQSFFTGFNFTPASVIGPVSPVPLPACLPLMFAGLAAFGFLKRRKTV